MKKIAYLSIILFAASCGGKKAELKKDSPENVEQVAKTEQQILTENKIKMITTHHLEISNGKPDSSKKELNEIKEFDQKGNLVRMESYFGDGGTKHLYTYNTDGKIASFDLKDNKDNLIRHYELTYENGLNTVKKVTNGKGAEITTITHTYDNKGNCIEMVNAEKDSTQSSRDVYAYDEKGRQISRKTYNAKKMLKEESTVTYHTDTTYTEVNKYFTDADAPVSQTTVKVTMNKNRQVVKKETIENEKTGVGIRHDYEYEASGLLLGIWIYDLPETKPTGYKKMSYAKH